MNKYSEDQITILVVDDDPMNRTLLRDWLEFIYPQCQILEAENGQAGLLAAQAQQPDLIFLDLHMPVMNGYEMTLAMQKMTHIRPVPIILCTCEDANDPYVMRLSQLCEAVLAKPVSANLLARALGAVRVSPSVTMKPAAQLA